MAGQQPDRSGGASAAAAAIARGTRSTRSSRAPASGPRRGPSRSATLERLGYVDDDRFAADRAAALAGARLRRRVHPLRPRAATARTPSRSTRALAALEPERDRARELAARLGADAADHRRRSPGSSRKGFADESLEGIVATRRRRGVEYRSHYLPFCLHCAHSTDHELAESVHRPRSPWLVRCDRARAAASGHDQRRTELRFPGAPRAPVARRSANARRVGSTPAGSAHARRVGSPDRSRSRGRRRAAHPAPRLRVTARRGAAHEQAAARRRAGATPRRRAARGRSRPASRPSSSGPSSSRSSASGATRS